MFSHVLMLDVEALGLHGEGFAWATVLTDQTGTRLDERVALGSYHEAYAKEQTRLAKGAITVRQLHLEEDRQWMEKHVLPALETSPSTCHAFQKQDLYPLKKLRRLFLDYWKELKHRYPGIVLAADCPFPVEAAFLLQAFHDNPQFLGYSPYPLLDVGTVKAAFREDPLSLDHRREDELPVHHPLHDARQSSRIFHELMNRRWENKG